MELETRRQLVHASGALFPIYIRWSYERLGIAFVADSFAAAILIGLALSYAYRKKIRLPLISQLFDATERQEMKEKMPAKGALMFFLGSLSVMLLFGYAVKLENSIDIICAAIVILALGDSASTLAGKNFGRHKIFYNREKSWEGSVAGFLAAFLGAATQVSLSLAFIGALAGMLAESLPLKIDDNVTTPLAAAAAMGAAVVV